MNKNDVAYTLEMLEFAKTIKGRERTESEKKIAQEAIELQDDWHYFMVFGMQPDTQAYIDKTIMLLEKCNNLADQVICNCRLDATVEDLGIQFPSGSGMEKHWQNYQEWKANNPDK